MSIGGDKGEMWEPQWEVWREEEVSCLGLPGNLFWVSSFCLIGIIPKQARFMNNTCGLWSMIDPQTNNGNARDIYKRRRNTSIIQIWFTFQVFGRKTIKTIRYQKHPIHEQVGLHSWITHVAYGSKFVLIAKKETWEVPLPIIFPLTLKNHVLDDKRTTIITTEYISWKWDLRAGPNIQMLSARMTSP